ncbi:hypothetical protein WJX73_005463 [Symbiochloris irregularis]|uniref:Uncharacterized protein n=1 Tax=Symbiochloris irregularis TaxID=706552 RepID=A0AAW1NK24_9CHLO
MGKAAYSNMNQEDKFDIDTSGLQLTDEDGEETQALLDIEVPRQLLGLLFAASPVVAGQERRLTLSDALRAARNFMKDKLYATELSLCQRCLPASPNAPYHYQTDTETASDVEPSAVEGWPLSELFRYYYLDASTRFSQVKF